MGAATSDQRRSLSVISNPSHALLAHRRALGAYARMLTRDAATADDLLERTAAAGGFAGLAAEPNLN
jgi:DNA-directed RNA polymerase specialized sigma24 family protein